MASNPCPTFIPCKPCADGNPFQNRSAEAPDPADFFSFQFVQDIPPLGGLDNWWSGTAIPGGCFASTQELADDCARRVGEEQIVDDWRDKNGITLPLFGNTPQSCSVVCPLGGDPFVYTVPAGTVIARTQEEADELAASYCQFRALEHRACGPLAITLDATNIASNATLNGSVNPDNAATTWYFQWGATTAYGNVTPAQIIPGSNGTTLVSAVITGFGATTHFRLVATNANGTSFGTDKTFQSAILPPIAWWKMEEAGDDQTPRIDIITGLKWGGPGNGSVFPAGVEAVSQAAGKVNQGMRINGSGQGYMGNIVPYNGSVMDITLWVKLSSISGSYRYTIFQMTWNNGGANAYELRYRSDTAAYDLIYGGVNIIISPPFFGTGAWHFLRLLFDGINLRMSYQLDNGAILSAALPGGSVNPPAAPNNALFNIMNVQSGGPGAGDASFDEFAIWDRKLTQTELDILYNNGNGVTWPIT